MTPKSNESLLNANGEYSLFPVEPGRDVRLEWSFLAGTATVAPGYVDMQGNFQPVLPLDGSAPVFAAAGGMCDVGIGVSGLAALKVESAAGLNLKICQTLKPLR